MAERVNGILKQEYDLDRRFRTKAQAIEAFKRAVWLYNHRRPHLKLDYRMPAEVRACGAPRPLRRLSIRLLLRRDSTKHMEQNSQKKVTKKVTNGN
jgi:hypothetical protein